MQAPTPTGSGGEGAVVTWCDTAPSRSMLADALAQCLVETLAALVPGGRRRTSTIGLSPTPLRRSPNASAPRSCRSAPSATLIRAPPRRMVSREQIQERIPASTQGVPDMTCSWSPTRPVNSATTCLSQLGSRGRSRGTQGLVPTSWHPALEQWGAAQFQNRFLRLANRPDARRSTTMCGWRFARSARRQRRARALRANGHHCATCAHAGFETRRLQGAQAQYIAPGTANCDSPFCSRLRS